MAKKIETILGIRKFADALSPQTAEWSKPTKSEDGSSGKRKLSTIFEEAPKFTDADKFGKEPKAVTKKIFNVNNINDAISTIATTDGIMKKAISTSEMHDAMHQTSALWKALYNPNESSMLAGESPPENINNDLFEARY